MRYQASIVTAYWKTFGIPEPVTELVFHPTRKWRFDFAWPDNREWVTVDCHVARPLCIEVQGGLFISGRHSRGAALIKEHEKLNAAAELGWRIMYCQPKDVCTKTFAEQILRSLKQPSN